MRIAGLQGLGLPCACRGHNGKVRSIVWSHDDTRLASAGADGAVYEWGLAGFKREREIVIKVLCCQSREQRCIST